MSEIINKSKNFTNITDFIDNDSVWVPYNSKELIQCVITVVAGDSVFVRNKDYEFSNWINKKQVYKLCN